MEYFCKYLSICYLGSANPSHGDKNSGEDGFPYIDSTADQLKRDRSLYHDSMHAGVDPKYLPMSQMQGEKGVDVALAVDALQVGLGQMIDVAVLVTGDGDFVPLVRALNKQGVRVLATYFAFETKEHKQDFAALFRKS